MLKKIPECKNCGCREETHPIPECNKFDPRIELKQNKNMREKYMFRIIKHKWGILTGWEGRTCPVWLHKLLTGKK